MISKPSLTASASGGGPHTPNAMTPNTAAIMSTPKGKAVSEEVRKKWRKRGQKS